MLNTVILMLFLLPTYFLGLVHLHLYVMKKFYTEKKEDIDVNKLREELRNEILNDLQVQTTHLEMERKINRDKIDRAQLRLNLDVDKIEFRIKHLAQQVMDKYVLGKYLVPNQDNSFDIVIEDINRKTRQDDMKIIFENLRAIINKDTLYEDLGLLYDLESVKLNEFIIAEYIAPSYNKILDDLIEGYRAKIQTQNALDEQIKAQVKGYEDNQPSDAEKVLTEEINEVYEEKLGNKTSPRNNKEAWNRFLKELEAQGKTLNKYGMII